LSKVFDRFSTRIKQTPPGALISVCRNTERFSLVCQEGFLEGMRRLRAPGSGAGVRCFGEFKKGYLRRWVGIYFAKLWASEQNSVYLEAIPC
jgi:hypothetical protein